MAFSAKSQTLPVGIVSFIGTYSPEWGLVFGSVVVSSLPIVIVFLVDVAPVRLWPDLRRTEGLSLA